MWFVALCGGLRGTVFAAVAALALMSAGVQSWRLQVSEARIASARSEIAFLRAVDEANRDTITKLRTANVELADAVRADLAEAERAAAEVEKESDRLRGELQVERELRRKLYRENGNAKLWAEAAVPAAIVDRMLRDRPDRPD